ncbi:hypothetical protein QQS21_008877 [Conoideocrella luteorostrata]|uniref:Uncharacterized protein n=1 Tax=Conoideocrella luteorostrata TaxID=1105319 RepID=A0AAJ0FQT4_9HYPO|nr:hypothetical protein QQS21_008877 [Conoideocrella luteorostrata]
MFSASVSSLDSLPSAADYEGILCAQLLPAGSHGAGLTVCHDSQTRSRQFMYDSEQVTYWQNPPTDILPSNTVSTHFPSDAFCFTKSSSPMPSHVSSTSANVDPRRDATLFEQGINTHNDLLREQSRIAAAHQEFRCNCDSDVTEMWADFHRQLRTVFHNVKAGQLKRASEILLDISGWMLTHVVQLGLHLDDEALYKERLQLWDDFNHGWLALAFQQRELMSSNRQISAQQRLMSKRRVTKMGDELIRLCDGIEAYGLVDYQYGVWEEQIETGTRDTPDKNFCALEGRNC